MVTPKMCLILQIRPEYPGDSLLATTSQGSPDKDLGTGGRKVGLLVPAATESGLSLYEQGVFHSSSPDGDAVLKEASATQVWLLRLGHWFRSYYSSHPSKIFGSAFIMSNSTSQGTWVRHQYGQFNPEEYTPLSTMRSYCILRREGKQDMFIYN